MRKDFYDVNDAGKTFFWAVVTPQILGIIVYSIYLYFATSLGITIQELLNQTFFTYILIMMSQVAFAIVFFSYNRKFNFVKACKINKLSTRNIIICIAIAIVVVLGISPISNIVVVLLQQAGLTVTTTLPIELNTIWELFLAIFLIAFIPAIFEELIFRGALLQGLRKFGTWPAVFGSAALFSIMHASAAQLVYTFIFGVFLAMIVIKSGSIISSMICHFTANSISLIFSFIQFEDEALATIPDLYYLVAFTTLCLTIILVVSLIRQMKNDDHTKKYVVDLQELKEIKELANSEMLEELISQNAEQKDAQNSNEVTDLKEQKFNVNDAKNVFIPNNSTTFLTYGTIIAVILWCVSFVTYFA